MYVCICQGITEKQLREAASRGVSPRDALSRLKVGRDCGICLSFALESLDQVGAAQETAANKR